MRSVATISVANNYIIVKDFYGEFEAQVLRPYCRTELTKFGQEAIPNSRKKRWVPTHVFARTNNDRTEYRMPLSILKDLMNLAKYRGYNEARIVLKKEPEIVGVDVDFAIKEQFKTPREHQHEWIDYQLKPGALKVNAAPTGGGKSQPLYAKVKIPGGWTTMGELVKGDKVIAWDGSVTYVTGVYPQDTEQLYRVKFEDGRSVDVGLDHMWDVFDHYGKEAPGAEPGDFRKVFSTRMLLELQDTKGRLNGVTIPLCKSERVPNIEDGFDHRYGSNKQRLNKLRSLMTKGFMVIDDRYLGFRSDDKEELEEAQYLVRSLGGKALYHGHEDGDTGHWMTVWYSRPEDLFSDPFYKKRAGELVKLEAPELAITSIEDLKVSEPVRCISIAHPSRLYITDDFIVTHNTYMSLFAMMKLGKRTLITIQPRYIPIWQKDLADMFDVAAKDVLIWEFTDLPRLGDIIHDGRIEPKLIILPTTRISTYMRAQRKDGNLPCLDTVIAKIAPGLRVIDESHESFHEVCLSMLYGNVAKTFMLSATLKGDDPFMNKMYLRMAPISIRLKEPEPENYIDFVAYLYQMDVRKYKIQSQQFGSYNDIALEKSILKSEALTNFYFELADEMYRMFYLDQKEPGTKCIFFFTLIEMALLMKEKFRERYPGEDFDTFLGTLDKKTPKKYMEHENLITTPGSCGTGKDIPGLITAISFHTVFSTQRNKQMAGRVRNLLGKFGGRCDARFVFPVCVDIPKHGECMDKRRLAFAAKQKSFRVLQSDLAMQ